MRAYVVIAALLVSGCASDTSQQFQLLSSDEPIDLVAPTTVLVQVFVVNAPSSDVTITSPNLPGFATISGETVQLTPVYEDAGDYTIDLVAHSGGATAHGQLLLHITGMNTGPMWLPVPYFTGGNSGGSPYPQIRAPVCDKEHDNFTFEVSVAFVDAMIPNTPDFTHFVDFSQIQPIMQEDGAWCADFVTELPNLPPGDYHGAVHAVDVHGAADPYGWVELGGTFHVNP